MMLKTLFYMVLSASLAGAIASGGILLLKAMVRGGVSPRVGRGLWLAALLLFLIPVRQLLPQNTPVSAEYTGTSYVWTVIPAANAAPDSNWDANAAVPAAPTGSIMRQLQHLPWHLVWVAGAFVFYCSKGVGYLRLRRLLRRCRPFTGHDAIARAALQVQVHAPVRVLCCDCLRTPLTFGILRPVILLPEPAPQENRLHMALLHELTHIKQHDLPLKLLALIVQGLHWFNPLAHLMTDDLDAACELLCDRRVVDMLGDDSTKEYCSLLIDTAAHSLTINAAPSAGLGRRGKTLKRRINAIMNHQLSRPVSGGIAISFVLCICLLGVACSPIVATPDTDTPVLAGEAAPSSQPDASPDAEDAQPSASGLTCTKTISKIQKEYDDDNNTMITISSMDSSTSIPLPDWMEAQQLGYAQVEQKSNEGHTITTYVLEPAPAGAAVPDWYEEARKNARSKLFLLQWPCPGAEISVPFDGYEGHTGVDFAAEKGSNICAAVSGIVMVAKDSTSGYGKHIIIDHGGGTQTLYAHCDELLVNVGQSVQAGDIIAKSGDSGNVSEPSLHFELRMDGQYIEPFFVWSDTP